MNSTTNYSGRAVDIELLQTISDPSGEKQVSISMTQPVARIVSGVQKTIQRYAAIFLSMKDSKFDPDLGTDVLKLARSGYLSTRQRIATTFAFANADVLEIMQKDDLDPKYVDQQPDDEKIYQVQLVDYLIDYSQARLSLRLLLTTLAGDAVEFILPTTAPRV